jgi:hypothetical protein
MHSSRIWEETLGTRKETSETASKELGTSEGAGLPAAVKDAEAPVFGTLGNELLPEKEADCFTRSLGSNAAKSRSRDAGKGRSQRSGRELEQEGSAEAA